MPADNSFAVLRDCNIGDSSLKIATIGDCKGGSIPIYNPGKSFVICDYVKNESSQRALYIGCDYQMIYLPGNYIMVIFLNYASNHNGGINSRSSTSYNERNVVYNGSKVPIPLSELVTKSTIIYSMNNDNYIRFNTNDLIISKNTNLPNYYYVYNRYYQKSVNWGKHNRYHKVYNTINASYPNFQKYFFVDDLTEMALCENFNVTNSAGTSININIKLTDKERDDILNNISVNSKAIATYKEAIQGMNGFLNTINASTIGCSFTRYNKTNKNFESTSLAFTYGVCTPFYSSNSISFSNIGTIYSGRQGAQGFDGGAAQYATNKGTDYNNSIIARNKTVNTLVDKNYTFLTDTVLSTGTLYKFGVDSGYQTYVVAHVPYGEQYGNFQHVFFEKTSKDLNIGDQIKDVFNITSLVEIYYNNVIDIYQYSENEYDVHYIHNIKKESYEITNDDINVSRFNILDNSKIHINKLSVLKNIQNLKSVIEFIENLYKNKKEKDTIYHYLDNKETIINYILNVIKLSIEKDIDPIDIINTEYKDFFSFHIITDDVDLNVYNIGMQK